MIHCTSCLHYRKLNSGAEVCTRRARFESPVDGSFAYPLCSHARSEPLQCGPGAKWFEALDELGLQGRRGTD